MKNPQYVTPSFSSIPVNLTKGGTSGVSRSCLKDNIDKSIQKCAEKHSLQETHTGKTVIKDKLKHQAELEKSMLVCDSSCHNDQDDLIPQTEISRTWSIHSSLQITDKKSQMDVTSFRHFYFRPVASNSSCPRQWQQLSTEIQPTTHFLRDAYYLQKMVKDYNLHDFTLPQKATKTQLHKETLHNGRVTCSIDVTSDNEISAYSPTQERNITDVDQSLSKVCSKRPFLKSCSQIKDSDSLAVRGLKNLDSSMTDSDLCLEQADIELASILHPNSSRSPYAWLRTMFRKCHFSRRSKICLGYIGRHRKRGYGSKKLGISSLRHTFNNEIYLLSDRSRITRENHKREERQIPSYHEESCPRCQCVNMQLGRLGSGDGRLDRKLSKLMEDSKVIDDKGTLNTIRENTLSSIPVKKPSISTINVTDKDYGDVDQPPPDSTNLDNKVNLTGVNESSHDKQDKQLPDRDILAQTGSSIDPEEGQEQQHKVDQGRQGQVRESTRKRLKARECFGLCHKFTDSASSVWSLKSYLFKVPVVIVTVCIIIFCGGWASINGIYYSLQQGVEWLVVVIAVLVVDVVVLEPSIYLCCAFISTQYWRKPLIINECLKRFDGVRQEIYLREWMVELSLAGRHVTSFIHHQAAPESASLYHLHDKIYKALKRVIGLPQVVFHTGVYWLLIYTACTLFLVNLQTDIYQSNMQNTFVQHLLGLKKGEHPISISEMWNFIELRLHPGLVSIQEKVNLSMEAGHQVANLTGSDMGCVLMSPVRFRQLRVRPLEGNTRSKRKKCSKLPMARIDLQRQCNFEFTSDNMETRSFGYGWWHPYYLGYNSRYTYVPGDTNLLNGIDLLPDGGYVATIFFDDITTRHTLEEIRQSDWIDEFTRYLVIDFSLTNPNSHIVSSFRIRFDFRRSAPFWHSQSFHAHFEQTGNQFYYFAFIGLIFINISAYNIIKEFLLLYKIGVLGYILRISSYIEIIKVILSLIMCYVYLLKTTLTTTLLKQLKYSYILREGHQNFVDFFEMAVMDYAYTVAGGFLAFVCIFQMFDMLSKIRRLLIFTRLLAQAIQLFFQPLMVGIAFACLAYILFGPTNENFSNLGISYLMVNQYFIKPRAIYHALADNHPILGPWFVFVLGFTINFFVVNFFIAFLNEAYSYIQNQVRIGTYKVREKTKLEYVYEFLGIQSTITWDIDEDLLLQDRVADKDYMADINRLRTI